MIKINYPPAEKRGDFHRDYIEVLNIAATVRTSYDLFMVQAGLPVLGFECDFSLANILTAKFADLLKMSSTLNLLLSPTQKDELKAILDYDIKNKHQPRIANFFKKKATLLNLRTCYFCNIDYINVFDDIGDYHDGLDFVKTATVRELKTIKGIGDVAAAKFLRQRGRINSIDELNISSTQKDAPL